jgi:hypothetical protein
MIWHYDVASNAPAMAILGTPPFLHQDLFYFVTVQNGVSFICTDSDEPHRASSPNLLEPFQVLVRFLFQEEPNSLLANKAGQAGSIL